MRHALRRAGVITGTLIAGAVLTSGTSTAVSTPRDTTTSTVPYLCRTIENGDWVAINGHTRGYQADAPASAKAGHLFKVTLDPAPGTSSAVYIESMKDIMVAYKLPHNAQLVRYTLSGGSGLGPAAPKVAVNGDRLTVTAPGPIAGGAVYDMPTVTLVLRAPWAGSVSTAPGGLSFEEPGFAFSRIVVGEDTWGPGQCYPDPAQPVVFSTTTVG